MFFRRDVRQIISLLFMISLVFGFSGFYVDGDFLSFPPYFPVIFLVLLFIVSVNFKESFYNSSTFVLFVCLFFILISITFDRDVISIKRLFLVFGVGAAVFLCASMSRFPEYMFKSFFYAVIALLSLSLLWIVFLYFFGETSIFPPDGGEYYRSIRFDGGSYGYLVSLRKIFYLDQIFNRPSGLTANANTISVYSVLSIILGFNFLKDKWIRFIFVFISIVLFLLSFSRGGFVFLISSLVFLHLFFNGKKSILCIFVVLIFCVPIVMSFFIVADDFGFVGFRVFNANIVMGEEILADPSRFSVWRLVLHSFLSNPFGGVGFGLVQEKVIQPLGIISSAHSVPFTILAELGVFGFVIMYVLWLTPIIVLIRKRAKNPLLNAIIAALLAGLFVHQCFDSSVLRYHPFNYIFFLLSGAAFNPCLYIKEVDKSEQEMPTRGSEKA
ncbi:O-antigen ligase family protein [Thalassospira alkalitolerans]|uniref:O-antigen ligase family protein n=1 Tax=Thalassospira alkalitolerans TaxID=1293890 RepID=UPI003AA860F7